MSRDNHVSEDLRLKGLPILSGKEVRSYEIDEIKKIQK